MGKVKQLTKRVCKRSSFTFTERDTGKPSEIEMIDIQKDSESYYSEVSDSPAVIETSLAYELKRELARRSLRLNARNGATCTCAGACNCKV
jgi:hypothetical protein